MTAGRSAHPASGVSCAILTGGRARRLGGRPKAALEIGGRTILARQIEALGTVPLASVYLVGADGLAARPPLPVVADAVPDGGAIGGLYTALIAAPTDPVLVVACDLPFVSGAFLAHLAAIASRAPEPRPAVVVPRTRTGWHPLCAVYRRRAAAVVKSRLDHGWRRVTDVLNDLVVHEVGPDEVARFDPDGVLLMNVNTPDDYRQACRYRPGWEHQNGSARTSGTA